MRAATGKERMVLRAPQRQWYTDRMTTATREARGILPLENGAHLSAQEFMERYEASGPDLKAELIEGVVYVASPVSLDHGDPHADLVGWLTIYRSTHPGVRVSNDATIRLDEKNVPQPDVHLRYTQSENNRRVGKYLHGAPELAAEVAVSSASIDLHEKLGTYRVHGVQEYIVWRVYDEAIDWFTLTDSGYERLLPDDRGVVWSKIFPGLRLAVQALVDGDMATVLATQMEPEAKVSGPAPGT